MSDKYTPTKDIVIECFMEGAAGEFIEEDFDRWLAEHDREVWRAGYLVGNTDGYFGSRDGWNEHEGADHE